LRFSVCTEAYLQTANNCLNIWLPSWVLVAHAYNPSYLGGWDWEDCRSRPAWAKPSQDPISTNSWVLWYVSVIPTMLYRLTWAKSENFLQNNQNKKGQAVKHLPNNREALSSHPSTTKRKILTF
jgi:hypothetical protein